jgi:GT2 family glycosyltransferase
VPESSTDTKVTIGVSIVIPSWNGLEFLKRFLPSVIAAAVHYQKESGAPTEIVIVDDGSTDDSVDWLIGQGFEDCTGPTRGYGPTRSEISTAKASSVQTNEISVPRSSALSLKLIRNEMNQGFGPTCNRGFEFARHPLVFLLNNDVEVDLNAIAPLVESFTNDSVFAVHCRVFDLESGQECGSGKIGGFSSGFIRVHRSYVNVRQVSSDVGIESAQRRGDYSIFATGGSAMFDRKSFLQIGAFDPLLAPIYWEDVDTSYRAWKRGYSVFYEPRSVVHHRVSSTMRKVNQSRLTRLKQRNRLICHWVNLHDRRLMLSHVIWVLLLSITAPLRLKPGFLLSVWGALKKLPEIRKRRSEERQAMRRSDPEVFEVFASFEKRSDIFCYDTYDELKELELKKRK